MSDDPGGLDALAASSDPAERLVGSMMAPLRDIGTLLATEVDKLAARVTHLEAELAELRSDLRAMRS